MKQDNASSTYFSERETDSGLGVPDAASKSSNFTSETHTITAVQCCAGRFFHFFHSTVFSSYPLISCITVELQTPHFPKLFQLFSGRCALPEGRLLLRPGFACYQCSFFCSDDLGSLTPRRCLEVSNLLWSQACPEFSSNRDAPNKCLRWSIPWVMHIQSFLNAEPRLRLDRGCTEQVPARLAPSKRIKCVECGVLDATFKMHHLQKKGGLFLDLLARPSGCYVALREYRLRIQMRKEAEKHESSFLHEDSKQCRSRSSRGRKNAKRRPSRSLGSKQ